MVIIELTSAELVSVRAPISPEFISIRTNENITINGNEIGFIFGKRRDMLVGALCQSGIVHSGWSGKLSPFFIVYGRWTVAPGIAIAHLVIFRME